MSPLPEWFWDEAPTAPPEVSKAPEIREEHAPWSLSYLYGGGWGAPKTTFLNPTLWEDIKNMAADIKNIKNIAAQHQNSLKNPAGVGLKDLAGDMFFATKELDGLQIHDEVQISGAVGKGNNGIHQMTGLVMHTIKGRKISMPKDAPLSLQYRPLNLDPTDKFVDAIVAGLKAASPSVLEAKGTPENGSTK